MRQIILAIISLFGIFSISSSTIWQRKKEIAVRKIMGANVNEIIGMFFREYLWMAYIAAIVAFPCTYAVMHHWLEQYAYHISIGMDLFIDFPYSENSKDKSGRSH